VKELVVTIPGMWADHHVLAVREALGAAQGVTDVRASALERRVTMNLDPGATTAEAVTEALTAAGYEPGELASNEGRERDKPGWVRAPRVTVTNAADHAMSGDHRKY